MTTTKRILSVRVRRKYDESPDLSYLGEYSDKPADVHIDRKQTGDMGRSEFRYFSAGCGDPEYIEQDYARAEAFNRGDWCMVGIWAEAKVKLSGEVVQTIRSGGLWNIESDSGAEYFEEVAAEELEQLSAELAELGFSADEVAAVEIVSDLD